MLRQIVKLSQDFLYQLNSLLPYPKQYIGVVVQPVDGNFQLFLYNRSFEKVGITTVPNKFQLMVNLFTSAVGNLLEGQMDDLSAVVDLAILDPHWKEEEKQQDKKANPTTEV